MKRLLPIGMLIAAASCLEQIKVDTEPSSGQLIVSGQVSTVPHRNVVQLGRSAGVERKQFDATGASVSFVDENGNSFPCTEKKPGIYSPTGFVAIPGVEYHVEIDIDGRHYESTPERVPTVAPTYEVSYDFNKQQYIDASGTPNERDFINIRSHAKIPSPASPYSLKWEITETWLLVPTDFPDPFGAVPPNCYINGAPDPQRIVLFDGRKSPSLDFNFLVASRLVDNSFHSKHAFFIHQSSITPAAYDYWRKVSILVNQVGSIFDTPPAEITGNVKNANDPSEKVYGYFQANNETYRRLTVYATDMPNHPLPPYCEYNASKFNFDYPYECLTCSLFPGSSGEEPELFMGAF